MDRYDQPNYIALLVVIIVGVTIGNLLSTWITAKATAYAAQQALEQLNRQLKQQTEKFTAEQKQAAQRLQDQQRAQHEAARRSRASSATGVKLRRQCIDWTGAADQLKSSTAIAERDRACGRYERYLETGIQQR